MYLYLSLVERKVAEFYHNIDRRRWLVWLKWLIFVTFSGQLMVSLNLTRRRILHLVTFKASYNWFIGALTSHDVSGSSTNTSTSKEPRGAFFWQLYEGKREEEGLQWAESRVFPDLRHRWFRWFRRSFDHWSKTVYSPKVVVWPGDIIQV